MTEKQFYRTLGDNIYRERVVRRITQSELAKVAGVTQVMIGRYERGAAKPSLIHCQRIASRFGMTIDDLAKERHEPTT